MFLEYIKDPKAKIPGTKMVFAGIKNEKEAGDLWAYSLRSTRTARRSEARSTWFSRRCKASSGDALRCRAPHHERPLQRVAQASVCTITGPAIAVAGPVNSGARSCSIHASARLFDSSAAA